MEQILGSFSIGLLLRSLFAGAFFVIAYAVAAEGPQALVIAQTGAADGSGLFTADAVGVSLFVGVVVYAFHRSVIYAPFEHWLNKKSAQDLRKDHGLISDDTIKVLAQKWDQGAEGSITLARSKHLSTWADFAHLQYASAVCIVLGAIFGIWIDEDEQCIYWPLVLIALMQAAAALLADWRLHAVREKIDKLAPPPPVHRFPTDLP